MFLRIILFLMCLTVLSFVVYCGFYHGIINIVDGFINMDSHQIAQGFVAFLLFPIQVVIITFFMLLTIFSRKNDR